jgi:hypothetical protein
MNTRALDQPGGISRTRASHDRGAYRDVIPRSPADSARVSTQRRERNA